MYSNRNDNGNGKGRKHVPAVLRRSCYKNERFTVGFLWKKHRKIKSVLMLISHFKNVLMNIYFTVTFAFSLSKNIKLFFIAYKGMYNDR